MQVEKKAPFLFFYSVLVHDSKLFWFITAPCVYKFFFLFKMIFFSFGQCISMGTKTTLMESMSW